MKLTNEFASNNLGAYIDCFNRHSKHTGEWPRKIIQFPNGSYGYKRVQSGVCSPIDEESDFNAVYFDYYFTAIKEVAE